MWGRVQRTIAVSLGLYGMGFANLSCESRNDEIKDRFRESMALAFATDYRVTDQNGYDKQRIDLSSNPNVQVFDVAAVRSSTKLELVSGEILQLAFIRATGHEEIDTQAKRLLASFVHEGKKAYVYCISSQVEKLDAGMECPIWSHNGRVAFGLFENQLVMHGLAQVQDKHRDSEQSYAKLLMENQRAAQASGLGAWAR